MGDQYKGEVKSNETMGSADGIYNDYTVSGTVNTSGYDLYHFKFTLSSSAQVQIVCISDYSSLLTGICDVFLEFLVYK